MLRAVPEELARAVAIDKRFGEVVAVKGASCTFRAGEIHAVCGENGAGKSTLLKVTCGMLVPDAGHVEAFGSRLSPHDTREAIRRGMGMVLQHFALVPVFTVLENVVLGAEMTGPGGVLDRDAALARARKLAASLGVELDWDARTETLGVGDRQRLEILRALFRDATLLVLDEPTAVLTKGEVLALYTTLRTLADEGKGIVVVTHKMNEVRAHADVVTVMRKGEIVFTKPIDRGGDVDAQIGEVTSAIMGGGERKAETPRAHDEATPRSDEAVLSIVGLVLGRALAGIDLEVRAGEIVGIAGVEGNGQRELVGVLAGDLRADAGTVKASDVAVIREDRHAEGLVLDASLRDNIVLGELGRFAGRFGILRTDDLEAEARARLARSGAPTDPDREARTLSGGNQQKIVVTRALARNAKVLVAAQPTRGIDLGASRDVHERLRAAARDGAGVLVVSADLDELKGLCDRVLVIARGRIVADLPPTESDEHFGTLMLGVERSA